VDDEEYKIREKINDINLLKSRIEKYKNEKEAILKYDKIINVIIGMYIIKLSLSM
jgi:hypothetical protein